MESRESRRSPRIVPDPERVVLSYLPTDHPTREGSDARNVLAFDDGIYDFCARSLEHGSTARTFLQTLTTRYSYEDMSSITPECYHSYRAFVQHIVSSVPQV